MIYDILGNTVLLRVRLTPNSSSCRVNGVFEDAEKTQFLKICVVSVPEKGKANKELLTFLSKKIGIAKSQMEIISGELDRYKKIKIIGDISAIALKLQELITEAQDDSSNY